MRANQKKKFIKKLALLIDEYIFGYTRTLCIHIHSMQCKVKPTKLQSQPTLNWLLKKSYIHIFYKHWIVVISHRKFKSPSLKS